jgi:hypothetical protein
MPATSVAPGMSRSAASRWQTMPCERRPPLFLPQSSLATGKHRPTGIKHGEPCDGNAVRFPALRVGWQPVRDYHRNEVHLYQPRRKSRRPRGQLASRVRRTIRRCTRNLATTWSVPAFRARTAILPFQAPPLTPGGQRREVLAKGMQHCRAGGNPSDPTHRCSAAPLFAVQRSLR